MYVFKNALRSLTRAKGRSILNFILIFIIAVSSCVALSIKHSSQSAKEAIYDSLKVTAQIGINREKVMQNMGEDRGKAREDLSKSLSLDDMKKYATSQYVKSFNYNIKTSLNASNGLEAFSTSQSNNSNNMKMPMQNHMRNSGDFEITGYDSHNSMSEFIDGTYQITSGSMFDENDTAGNAVISSELATLNNLKVGDKIELENPNKDSEKYNLSIVGIYKNSSSSSESNMFGGVDKANQIFVSYNYVNSIIENSSKNAVSVESDMGDQTDSTLRSNISGTYVLDNVEGYENFKKDVVSMGLDDSIYEVTSQDVSQYEQSITPLNNLTKYTMIFFIVVLTIGGAIIVIFNLFAIRERKYEIGVLSAIGMNKRKVASQFIIEALIISLLAIFIGAGVGATSSNNVANSLLKSQIETAQQSNESTSKNFGGNFQGKMPNREAKMTMGGFGHENSHVNYIDSIKASTDLVVLAQLVGIGMLLTLVASSTGIISILRYEPLKILSDRG